MDMLPGLDSLGRSHCRVRPLRHRKCPHLFAFEQLSRYQLRRLFGFSDGRKCGYEEYSGRCDADFWADYVSPVGYLSSSLVQREVQSWSWWLGGTFQQAKGSRVSAFDLRWRAEFQLMRSSSFKPCFGITRR